jgi:hypothetical protein
MPRAPSKSEIPEALALVIIAKRRKVFGVLFNFHRLLFDRGAFRVKKSSLFFKTAAFRVTLTLVILRLCGCFEIEGYESIQGRVGLMRASEKCPESCLVVFIEKKPKTKQ